jgi:hypothetical protein
MAERATQGNQGEDEKCLHTRDLRKMEGMFHADFLMMTVEGVAQDD